MSIKHLARCNSGLNKQKCLLPISKNVNERTFAFAINPNCEKLLFIMIKKQSS